jgi:hypothetical protein
MKLAMIAQSEVSGHFIYWMSQVFIYDSKTRGFTRISVTIKPLASRIKISADYSIIRSEIYIESVNCIFLWYLTWWIPDFYYHNVSPIDQIIGFWPKLWVIYYDNKKEYNCISWWWHNLPKYILSRWIVFFCDTLDFYYHREVTTELYQFICDSYASESLIFIIIKYHPELTLNSH